MLSSIVATAPGADDRQACSYNLSPPSANFTAAGASNQLLGVIAGSGCAWTADPSDAWITISAGQSGTGPGTLTYSVAVNQGPARNGSITVETKTFPISQANGCTYQLQPATQNFPPLGGTGGVAVTAFATCPYSAISNAPWITITSGEDYFGSQVVEFAVDANPGNPRTGTLTIAGQTHEVTQDGGCTYVLAPDFADAGSAAAVGSFTVTANEACAWTAVSTEPEWLIVTSGTSSQGDGVVQYTIVGNTGPARSARIDVADSSFDVTQASGCTWSIGPTEATFAATGGMGLFNVNTNDGCDWTAVADDDWITITEGASGSGASPVRFIVEANDGPARDGTITVADKTYTVHQGDGCAYFVTPTGVPFSKFGGSGTLNISTGDLCAWEALSDSAWLTITSPETGFGPGSVSYSVATNLGIQRIGTISVEGAALVVTQAAGCAYDVLPEEADFPTAGGDGEFDVNTTAECPWEATTPASWISFTNDEGTGPGTVAFAVAANAGPDREADITVGDQTFRVSQLGICTFAVAPEESDFTSAGGAGMFGVQTRADCLWGVESEAAWITITSPETSFGPGTVSYTVAANVGPAREGEIAVEDKIHVVTQEENCSYAIEPGDADFTAEGGDGAIALTATAGCAWTAQTAASWIEITSPASGAGDATVEYTIAENDGAPREATIVVADLVHTVRQDERSLSDLYTSLGVVGSAGFVDISSYVVEGAKGASGEIAMLDAKTGNATVFSTPSLAADAVGIVTGIVHLRILGPSQQLVAENDVPIVGRISHSEKRTLTIFPSGNGTTTIEALARAGKFSISGATADRAWSAKVTGSEKNTRFSTNGSVTSMVGEPGFLLKLATKSPFAPGKGAARITGWEPEPAEMVFTRASILPDALFKKWTTDGVVVSPFFEDPVTGGTGSIATSWFVAATGKAGKASIKAANGATKASASGQNFTTLAEASEPDFAMDDLQFFPTKIGFATPAAKSATTIQWDPQLLVPAPTP